MEAAENYRMKSFMIWTPRHLNLVIISKRMRWAVNVACTGKKINA